MPTAVPMPTPISRVRKRNGRSGGSKSQSPVDAMNGSAPTQGPTTPKQPLPPSLSRRNTPASSLFQTPAARSSLGTSQDPILVGDVDDGDDVEIVEIVSKSAPREQPPVSRALSATVISPPTTPPVPQKPTAVQPSSTPSNLNPTRTKPTLPPLQTSATQTSQSHNSTMPISPSSSNFPSALPQTPSHPPPISLPAISATTPQVNVLPPLHSPTASISTIASGTSSNTQKKRGKTKKKPLLSAVGAPSASAMPWAQDDLKWYKEHKGQRGDGASPVGGSPVVSNATPTAASPIVPTATTITTSGPTFRQLEQPPISASGDGRTPMDVDSVSQHGVQPSGKAPSGSSTAVQSDMSGSRQVSGTGSNGAVAAADDLPMEVDNEQSGQNKAPLHGGNVTQPPRDGITPGVVSAMPDPRDYAKMQAEPAFSVAPSFDTSPARPGYPQAGTVYNDAMMAPMSPSSSSLTGALGDTVIHRTTPSVSSRSVILSANPPVGRTEHAPDPVHVRKGSSGPSRSVSVSADAPAIQPERATETAMVVDVANENVAGDVMVLNDVPTMDDVATTSDEPPNTDMEISQPEPVSEPFPSNDIVEHLPAQDEGAASNEIVPVVEPAGDHVPHRAASPGAPLANGRLDQASIVASTPPPPPSMNGFSDLEMAHDDDTHSLGDSPLARARALSPAISVVTNASSSSKLSVIDPDASHFNSDTVISLGITRGDIAGKIVEFDLVINSEQAKPISLWCRRHEHEADVYIGVCLSLACYVPKSSIPADGEYDERVLTPKLLNLHPQWPSKRQLLAVVESTKRGQTCLCLSPPDMVCHHLPLFSPIERDVFSRPPKTGLSTYRRLSERVTT
ncbi:hypothetical protein BD410DRAFT_355599 [Rickenella mellea]|uniref:Uncharacterized protein n=1 Tax=Rickenella mellea TaxID=50990 RepID=A0A4Y7Q030_9AGAM|nr:hypothetical protein BD410DRAFT_355599 [Rickenella mellea]